MLTLLLLAPAIGELLSGSMPPAEFFRPPGFLGVVILYGGGALLVREAAARWGKGWPTILLLGAAYALLEEGLMVKSFFDPTWMDLDKLGHYGRWAGVNWVWAVHLTLYHAFISIATPILLVQLLYPDRRGEPWVGRRVISGLLVLLLAEAAFVYHFITPYRPPLGPYVAGWVVLGALIVLARFLPTRLGTPRRRQPVRARWFLLLGFGATLLEFGLAVVSPRLPHPPPPQAVMVFMAGLVAGWGGVLMRWTGNGAVWTARHQLALAAGGLGFFIVLAPLEEATNASRPDDTTGMTWVGLAALAGLIALAWRLRKAGRLISMTADGLAPGECVTMACDRPPDDEPGETQMPHNRED